MNILKPVALVINLMFVVISLLFTACNSKKDDPKPAPVDPYAAIIDLTATYQTIRGFGGATVFTPAGGLPSATDMNTLFGNGNGQIGLSILRIRVASDNDPNWRAVELNHALQAKAHGAIVIASPWSPPIRMKSNNNLIDGTIKTEAYEDYANYLKDFATYMATNNAELYAISVQNEPDISVSYESCRWTSTQMRDFLKDYGHLINNTKVIAPESFNFNQSFSDVILNDATAAANIDIVGGHIYGSGLSDYPNARNKGKELWMTEHYTNNLDANNWGNAMLTAKSIHDCLTIAQYNAYIWWYLKRYYGPLGEDGVVTKRGWVMANYSKFVRHGFYRIFASANPRPNIHVSAYYGNKLVVVALNLSDINVPQSFSLKNSTSTGFTPYTTSQTLNLNQGTTGTINDGIFSYTLPANSVTTFVVE